MAFPRYQVHCRSHARDLVLSEGGRGAAGCVGSAVIYARQPTPYTCGQTCVAMLTGVDVQTVIHLLGAGPTSADHLCRMLAVAGWRAPAGTKLRRFHREAQLPAHALVRVLSDTDGKLGARRVAHWIVWANARAWDPARPRVSALADLEVYGSRATSYVELERGAS